MPVKLFILILIANAGPVLAARLCGPRLNRPIDGGRLLWGRPLFGPTKTWRGLVAAVVATTLVAPGLGLPWGLGAGLALAAMAGDLLASFSKRRLGIAPSGMALGLDQVPESLLPLLLLQQPLGLDWTLVLGLVVAFVVTELLLSRIGYRLGLRKRPY